jgi:hypothetical protein
MSISKEKILEAIRKTAQENSGRPLGEVKFQKEAGFEPNQFQVPYSDEFISEKIIGLIRKLKKFPTTRERIVERNIDSDFPSHGTFRRLRTQEKIATMIL